MNNSSAKKALYCGIAFVGTLVLTLVLTLLLNFSSARIDGEEVIKVSANGFRILLGLLGFKGVNNGTVVDLGTETDSSVFLYIAAVLMPIFFILCAIMLVLCIQKLIKKENIINAPFFYKWMLAILLVCIALLGCSIVISNQIATKVASDQTAKNPQTLVSKETMTWFWIPLVLIIAIDVLAHEFLQKFEYEQYAPETSESETNEGESTKSESESATNDSESAETNKITTETKAEPTETEPPTENK